MMTQERRMILSECHHEPNTHRIDRKTVRGARKTLSEPGKTGVCVPNTASQGFQLHPLLAAHRLPMGAFAD